MEAKAKLSDYRQSPRKVRLLADLVRGKKVATALALLAHANKRAAPAVAKVIASAAANARVLGMEESSLVVAAIAVDKGMVLSRWMPRAFGRAFPIKKRTSHVTVTLRDARGATATLEKTDVVTETTDAAPKAKKAPAKKVVAKRTAKKAE